MITYIDFDNCLFNTQKLIDECKHVATRHGIPLEKFTLSLDLFSSASFESGQTYNFEKHIETLKSLLEFNEKELLEEWKECVTPELHFEGANDLLTSLPGEKILVTYGDIGFQTFKATKTGLWEMFDNHFIASDKQEDKINLIKKDVERKSNYDIFYLEDRKEYLEEAIQIIPSLTAILIQHKQGRYHYDSYDGVDHVATSLPQAKEIILNSTSK